MRRQKVFGFTAVTVVAFLLGHGIAAAQAQTGTPAPDANAGVTRQVNLSPAEQVAQSESTVNRMDSSRTVIGRMLSNARAQRDVVKTLCLNDKLNQIDVAIRSARERKVALESAAQRNDADLANHEFTILTVLSQRAAQLSAEANQCIGKEVETIGDNVVTSSVEGVPPDSPWIIDIYTVVAEKPACDSCFR